MKAVIFDLDGTLLDSLGVFLKVDEQFFLKRDMVMPSDYQKAILSMSFYDAAVYTIDRFQLQEKPEDIVQEWIMTTKDLYQNEVGLKKGGLPLLQRLNKKQIPVIAATSCLPVFYEPCLKRLGVDSFISRVFCSETMKLSKRDPLFYQAVFDYLNRAPAEIVLFDDDPLQIRFAKTLGLNTIQVAADSDLNILFDKYLLQE